MSLDGLAEELGAMEWHERSEKLAPGGDLEAQLGGADLEQIRSRFDHVSNLPSSHPDHPPWQLVTADLGVMTLLRLAGAGAYGWTFQGLEAGERDVAIKVMPTSDARDRDAFEIEREQAGRIAAGDVHHASLLPLRQSGFVVLDEGPTFGWLAWDWVEGAAIDVWDREGPGLDQRGLQRLDFLLDVIQAVAVMHARGMHHRDIKPDNIRCGDEQAFLIDFGFARDVSALVAGNRAGYPDALHARHAIEADVYALATTLLQTLGAGRGAEIGGLLDTDHWVFLRDEVEQVRQGLLNGERTAGTAGALHELVSNRRGYLRMHLTCRG